MIEAEALPFNEEFQEAIIGHCIKDAKFFLKCSSKLQAEWFTKNYFLGAIFQQMCSYYKADSKTIQSSDELKNFSFFLEQTLTEKEKYYNLIERCKISAGNFNLERIEKQLTAFLRISLFKESIEGAARRYKNSGYEEAYAWTKQRIDDLREASFEDQKNVLSFDNPGDWIVKQESRLTNGISTGSKILDNALGGGLFKKEACVIMAPVNTGKTVTMLTVARHAVWQKKHVLFLLHEGDPEEIRLRFLCSFLGIRKETLFVWNKDPIHRTKIIGASRILNQHLTLVPYIKTGGMFVEDVVELIKKMNEEKKINNDGKGYDLIIDDYPKKLRSRLRIGSKEGLHRAELAEIYDSFNHLSTEINVHCLIAAQTNRAGLKMNNNKMEATSLLGMEEVDESFGIMQNIPNVITLNRSADDRKRNILRINIAKSRNSVTDISINTRTNYSTFLTFGDKDLFGVFGADLEYGFLPADVQEDNSKVPSEDVDLALKKIEEILVKNPNSGVYPPGGKLEA